MLFGDRGQADDAAVEGLVQLEVLLLCTLNVHSVDPASGAALLKCVSLVLFVRVLFHGAKIPASLSDG